MAGADILGGIPDDLEIGLHFGHWGELQRAEGFVAECILVDDGDRTSRRLLPANAEASKKRKPMNLFPEIVSVTLGLRGGKS